MKHNYLFIFILGIVFVAISLVGCQPTSVEPTNTVDISKLPLSELNRDEKLTKCKRYLIAFP